MYNLSVISLNTQSKECGVSMHSTKTGEKAKATANSLDTLEFLLNNPTQFFHTNSTANSVMKQIKNIAIQVKHIKIKGNFSSDECARLAQIIDTFSKSNACLKGEALVFKKCKLEDPKPLRDLAAKYSWDLVLRDEKADAKM